MAIIALKAWYIAEYEPIDQLEQRPQDLRLSKNSLLKSALRADFLDDSDRVRTSPWFRRYLEGETVEFYIEGSGSYAISNIDLISHEIYFTKRDTLAHLEPTLFFCYQTDYPQSSDLLREALQQWLDTFNRRSRIPLTLEESHRSMDGPVRLSSKLLRKIRQSLVFIADGTPITQLEGVPPRLLPSPTVSVELGYALHCKRHDQILLAQFERSDITGQFPFDVPSRDRLLFRTAKELLPALSDRLAEHLAPFNLV
jgi:hypothetical protein